MSLIGTLTSGVSAMRTFTKGLEVIGNNIANVNTTGFKSSQANFSDSFSNTLKNSAPSSGGASNSGAIQVGTGVRLASVSQKFTQGALTTTDNGTDLGISGSGFFIVRDPVSNVEYATRSGNFRIDDNGYLVTTQGHRVQGFEDGTGAQTDIQLDPAPAEALKSFSFNKKGELVEFYADGTSATTNRVMLVNFNDPTALTKQGDNLYNGFASAGETTATRDPATNGPGEDGMGSIEAGTLELSNVDLTEQFANMITIQRSFQASSRLVTVSDTVLEDIVNLKR